jgi:hypothetical protein
VGEMSKNKKEEKRNGKKEEGTMWNGNFIF